MSALIWHWYFIDSQEITAPSFMHVVSGDLKKNVKNKNVVFKNLNDKKNKIVQNFNLKCKNVTLRRET